MNLNFEKNEIELIEVYKCYPETKIEMKDGFEKEFIEDLNQSRELGPTKFAKSYKFIIHNKNKKVDTIFTNGKIHVFNGWFESKENLIEKYKVIETVVK